MCIISGCTAIYIGPLFESTSHGYDTRDYKLVDRRLGDNEDFRAFVGMLTDAGSRWLWTECSTTREENSLRFRIFRKPGEFSIL